MQHIGIVALLGLTGFLTIQALSSEKIPEKELSQRVNIALRQTVHQLLLLEKDDKSQIKPVQQTAATTWMIPVEQNFNYDSLPPLLQKALMLQQIEQPYNVAVLDCCEQELMLGYHSTTYLSGEEVPCGGRERVAECYQLTITLLEASKTGHWQLSALIGLVLAYLAYLWYAVFNKRRVATNFLMPVANLEPEPAAVPKVLEIRGFSFGQSVLDAPNQKLWVRDGCKDLTYREAKLLQFFCQHQNVLLERDQILKAVWEDEGILVGRSLDVFVSRLRKLLKEDATVKIVNVHSVGYRFEVDMGRE